MINTNNLMLNCHVALLPDGEGDDIMITEISKKTVRGVILPGGPEIGPLNDIDIFGIPITEDYLIAFHFNKKGDGIFISPSGFKIVKADAGLWDLSMLEIEKSYHPLKKGLEFVHQMQIAIWACTGDMNSHL